MTSKLKTLYTDLDQSFKKAINNEGLEERHFQIGPKKIKINFAGKELIKYCVPAIQHLAIQKQKRNSFTISVFDSNSTNSVIETNLWKNNFNKENKYIHLRNYFTDGNIKGIFHSESKAISIFNISANHAFVWFNSRDSIPFYSISSPFRSIFHWYFLEKEMQLIHAGAVGYNDTGALIVGPSGSGKSSTVSSCMQSKLKFAGDDHILVDSNKTMKAFCIYNAFKMKKEDISKYKNILKTEKSIVDDNYDKSIYLMNLIDPKKIIKSFRIKAIIIPVITSNKTSKIISTSPAQGLLSISPNTIFQLPGSGKKEYDNIVGLIKKTPVYRLELGSSSQNINNQIENLLSKET